MQKNCKCTGYLENFVKYGKNEMKNGGGVRIYKMPILWLFLIKRMQPSLSFKHQATNLFLRDCPFTSCFACSWRHLTLKRTYYVVQRRH